MNGDDKITIMKWITDMFAAQEKIRQSEREADKTALKLQAAEYERRLSDLNHENARILANNSSFVSNDKHDALEARVQKVEKTESQFVTMGEHATLIETLQKRADAINETVDRRLAILEKWQTSIDGKLIGAGAVITLLSVAIGIISHFWK